MPLNQLEAEVLDLSTRDRAWLAHRLLLSLDDDEDEDPAGVEAAWEQEIRSRLEELDAGSATLVPAEKVFAKLRERPRR